MKRILPILALAAISSFAGGLKYGADAAALLTIPSFSKSGAPDSKIGFGGKVAASAEYAINDQFAVRGNAGYSLTTWGSEKTSDLVFATMKSEQDAVSQFVTIGGDGIYSVTPKIQLLAGLGVDIPVSSTADVKRTSTSVLDPESNESVSTSGDIEDTQTSLFLEVGAGYVLSPAVSVNAKYKLALTDYIKDAVKLNQVQVGVSYNFGN